jgi:hypothetical protein
MPVWHDGRTVRGYKSEQFVDAWLRVVDVRGVSCVRTDPASEAPPNGPNASNAETPERPKPLVVGDDGLLELLDRALTDGHITESERRERRLSHFAVRGRGAM